MSTQLNQNTQDREPNLGHEFHNPYNFVPALPRLKLDHELGDHFPAPHDSFMPELYSGAITVTMETITPLLIPDAEQEKPKKVRHNTFDMLKDEQGRPLIPASSVRGMLRSAYEIITNSRFSIFPKKMHRNKLDNKRKNYEHDTIHLWELLDDSLHPAMSLAQLSPVDRVFGWVRQDSLEPKDKTGAWKGLLRLSPVRCLGSQYSIESFQDNPVPLAILASPKPKYARFYIAKDKNGTPLDIGIEKTDAPYTSGYSLRGRKVYPQHAGLPEHYWEKPQVDRTQLINDNWYQEYRRPKNNNQEQRDTQNKSIKAWIKSNTKFEFDIQFMNLSETELGALLWLLSLNNYVNENCIEQRIRCLRLGAGKPLGFGSVKLAIKSVRFAKDNEIRKKYKGWNNRLDDVSDESINQLIIKYQNSLMDFIGDENQSFHEIPCIKAFLVAAEGFNDGIPVHYPRTTEAPSPKGEAFKWFAENESNNGKKWSLPSLHEHSHTLRIYLGSNNS